MFRRGGRSLIFICKEPRYQLAHPSRQRIETFAKILADGLTLFGVVQKILDPLKDRVGIYGKYVVEPMKSLNNAHSRSARPIEPARGRELEIDYQLIELN